MLSSQKLSKLQSAMDEFSSKNPDYIAQMLGCGGLETTEEEITFDQEFLEKSDSILLLDLVSHQISTELQENISQFIQKEKENETHYKEKVFTEYLSHHLKESQNMLNVDEKKNSFATLFGVSNFLFNNQNIMKDNFLSTYQFFFSQFTFSWKKMLEFSHEELGLFNEQTKENITSFLKNLEEKINKILQTYDGKWETPEIYSRIEIFDTYEPAQPQPQTESQPTEHEKETIKNADLSSSSNQNANSSADLQDTEQKMKEEVEENPEEQLAKSSQKLERLSISNAGDDQDKEQGSNDDGEGMKQLIDLKKSINREESRKKSVEKQLMESRASQEKKNSSKKASQNNESQEILQPQI